MPTLRMDGRPSDVSLPPSATLDEAVRAATAHANAAGRVVVTVLLNGTSVSLDPSSPDWSRVLGPEDVVEGITAEPLELARSLFTRMVESLPAVAERHRLAIDAVRAGHSDDSTARIMEALSWWQEMDLGFSRVTELLGLEERAEWADRLSQRRRATEKVARYLGELKDALGQRDFVLVADLLEFELLPMIDDWRSICGEWKSALD